MHTGSAMSWVYLSIVRLRQVVVVFLRVPILSTIRLNTFSWNFIVDRFKSCLFFSLLNIAVAAAAAASIRSERNLAKHIVPFFCYSYIRTHPNVIFYDVNLFIWWISVCEANKIAILNLVKFIAEKEKEANKNTSHFLGISKRRQKKIHWIFLHVLLHGVPSDEEKARAPCEKQKNSNSLSSRISNRFKSEWTIFFTNIQSTAKKSKTFWKW